MKLKTMILAAMFLAIGLVLPSITGSIKEIGDSLLPMHLVVMLCGAICGWKYGLSVGLILPFLRSVTFGMPPIYPNAVWMAAELATYGAVIGIIYAKSKTPKKPRVFIALVCAMIAGRIVWGITKAALLGIAGKTFGIQAFIVGGFLDAIPGLILQFILIPAILLIFDKQIGSYAAE